MKNKKLLIGICVIFVIIIGSLIWWNAPCSITNIAPSEVSKIEIFDGNTGKSITITNTTDIEHIINNINMISLKKEKISLGYMGYSYRTTVYKVNGNVYKKFIINSSDTIRRDPFFYRDSTVSIDYKYIQKLFNKGVK
jgi:hypothetical protein